jgi:hypothetical protein
MLLAGSYTDSPGGVREAGSVSFFRSRCDTVHVQSLSILLTGTAPVLQRTCRVVLIGGRPRLFCTSMRVGTNYTLAGEALLLDQDGAPLPGAEVDLTVSISGSFRRRTVVSDPIGGVRLSLGTFYVPKNRSRRVTLSVRDVRKPGFTFDRKGSILRTSRDL